MTFELTSLQVSAFAAVVSLLSLFIALTTLTYTHRTYNRAGPRISLELEQVISGESLLDVKLLLKIYNSGLAETDIDSVGIRLLGHTYPIGPGDISKAEGSQIEVPQDRIKANQTGKYWISLSGPLLTIIADLRSDYVARNRTSRIYYSFSMLLRVYSQMLPPWREVPAIPTIFVELGGKNSSDGAELSSAKLARRLWRHLIKHYRAAFTRKQPSTAASPPPEATQGTAGDTPTDAEHKSTELSSVETASGLEEQAPETD